MIVMVNGAFGVGKTSVAQVLVERLPNAMLYDPELVGTLARYLTEGVRSAAEQTDDFQDIVIWPGLTVLVAEQLRRHYGRTLIIPMTIANPQYFATIRDGLARLDRQLYHFCLTAPLTTIQQRLLQRGDAPGSWPWQKSLQYVARLESPLFHEHIPTQGRPVSAIADHILRRIAALAADEAPGAGQI